MAKACFPLVPPRFYGMIGPMLHDSFSRKFSYLRLSLTEVCNFKCRYCLPGGYDKPSGSNRETAELNLSEIEYLLKGVARAGFKKLRLTGGEPTLRRDLPRILSLASSLGSFEQIALSTNGWNLARSARSFFEAGLSQVNVSVDSLDSARFHALAGRSEKEDLLNTILAGIEECLSLGFKKVKINSVLHADTAQLELERFLDYIKLRPVTVRFIELMRTRSRPEYRDHNFVSAGSLRLSLLRRGFEQVPRSEFDGPAIVYRHPDFIGSIGLISPYSEGFCESCNRLRVTSQGNLRLCLFGEEEFSLRPYLQDEKGSRQIPRVLSELLVQKPQTHLLQSGRSGLIQSFSQVGG